MRAPTRRSGQVQADSISRQGAPATVLQGQRVVEARCERPPLVKAQLERYAHQKTVVVELRGTTPMMNPRNAILASCIWLLTIAITAALAHSGGLFRAGGFVERFQTLIGAFVALLAAAIAVVPVWRQLDRMAMQTHIALRETLNDRLSGVRRRKAAFVHLTEKLLSGLSIQITEMIETETNDVDPEWAFAQQHASATALGQFRDLRAQWRDSADIAAAMDAVDAAADHVIDTLDPIHRPQSLDRYDEDYSFTDEDWAKVEDDALAARKALIGVANDLDRAVTKLIAAFDGELISLRERLHDLDLALIHDRSA
jgi:hypothetical protein